MLNFFRIMVALFIIDTGTPWMSFGSDEVIVKYRRDEKLMSLQQAIYKLVKLPDTHLKLQMRGELKVGYYAIVIVFDPATVQDHATYNKPHQYATGVSDAFVNGLQVLKND